MTVGRCAETDRFLIMALPSQTHIPGEGFAGSMSAGQGSSPAPAGHAAPRRSREGTAVFQSPRSGREYCRAARPTGCGNGAKRVKRAKPACRWTNRPPENPNGRPGYEQNLDDLLVGRSPMRSAASWSLLAALAGPPLPQPSQGRPTRLCFLGRSPAGRFPAGRGDSAHMLWLRVVRRMKTKNGAPRNAVTTPSGSSAGEMRVRATMSTRTRNAPPASSDIGRISR